MEDCNTKPYVIYTAIVGQYELIVQPQVVHPDFDYVLFTNNDIKEESIGVWQIWKIPYQNTDNTRVARWVKTHPEQLLGDYTYSIWMDANIQILSESFYDYVFKHVKSNVLVSSMWHNQRNCIYDEIVAVAYYELENEYILIDWLRVLLKEKYPQHNGLFETGVLFRSHSSEIVAKMDEMWWSVIDNYSRRDQLSFNYVLWKYNIECPYFISDSENVRNTTCVKYNAHSNPQTREMSSCKRNFVFINYYKTQFYNLEIVKAIYIRIAKLPFPHFLLYVLGQVFRILSYIKYLIRKVIHF